MSVTLESPSNNTTTMNNQPDFKFTATHSSNPTLSCTLWLKLNPSGTPTAYGTNGSVVNGASTIIRPSSPVANGQYQWWINCSDGVTSIISEKRTITVSVIRGTQNFTASNDGSTRYYWLDLPDHFDSSVPTPLVIFLHGYGQDRTCYDTYYPGLEQIFRQNRWMVVCPECRYVGSTGYQDWYSAPSRSDITDVIHLLEQEFSIDRSHIDVMGTSMGGSGALKYAMFNPDIIASACDVMGVTNFTEFYYWTTNSDLHNSIAAAYGGTPSQVPQVYNNESPLGNEIRFMHTPLFLLHGSADTVVPVSNSRNLNNSLSQAGYVVKYDEVPGVDHYGTDLIDGREQEIYQWFRDHPLEGSPTVTISPTQLKMYVGQSQTFSSSVSGGTTPYSYQWYLNDTAVSGATGSTWTFTPTSAGHYKVYLNVTDGFNFRVQSNVVSNILVCSVYLLLTEDPVQGSYVRGQTVTFTVNVFNQLDPALGSSLTLTVTEPSSYGYFDVQPISVPAGTVGEYTFNWVVPNVAGKYVVEVELVPSMLTAYDTAWLKVT